MSERLGAHYDRYGKNVVTEFNQNQFDMNDYSNVYTRQFNEQYSTQQESDIQYEQVDYYFTISSRDRDISTFPNVNKYSVVLPREFKNIYSIEVIQAIIPDANSVTNEPYLLLKIDELEDVMTSIDRNISDAFAILQMSSPTTPGGFIHMDKRIHENTVKYFRIPKASLAKLSVTITDCNGTLFDFGADGPNPPLKTLQNTFVFRVVCLEKQRNALSHRNVF